MTHRQMPQPEGGRPMEDAHARRVGARQLTVYRVAKVMSADDVGLWRVRNMSDRGMSLETDAAIDPNEKLEIALSETVNLTGRVVWSGHGRCGVAFDHPIFLGEVLRQLVAERESEGYRPLRLPVCCPARLMFEANEIEVIVTSISQLGIGFVHQGELREVTKVDLVLADGVWRNGNIRWLRDGTAGLRLTSPIALPELESVRRFSGSCGA